MHEPVTPSRAALVDHFLSNTNTDLFRGQEVELV